jgi:hypothetical protein
MSSQVLGVLVSFVMVRFRLLAVSRTFLNDCTRAEVDYIGLLARATNLTT